MMKLVRRLVSLKGITHLLTRGYALLQRRLSTCCCHLSKIQTLSTLSRALTIGLPARAKYERVGTQINFSLCVDWARNLTP